MRFSEINPDVEYLYATRPDWKRYFGTWGSSRCPITVADPRLRFSRSSWKAWEFFPDPAGRYLRGVDHKGGTRYVMARHLVGPLDDCRRQAEEVSRDERAMRDDFARQTKDASERVARLVERLAALGVVGVSVDLTDDRRGGPPRVNVRVGADHGPSAETVLGAIVDRLELSGPGEWYHMGFRAGEAANDAARDKRLGYALSPDQVEALKAYGD